MTTIAPTAQAVPRRTVGRPAAVAALGGCLRLAFLAGLGLADPQELAEAGVAAPGHRGGLRIIPRTRTGAPLDA